MGTDSTAAGDWMAAVQKAQADLLKQWSQLSQAALGATGAAASGGAPSGGGAAGATEGLARQFLQQCEQYLGVSQSLWDLLARSTAITDPDQRARHFMDGAAALQQQFSALWASAWINVPGAGAGAGAGSGAGSSWPGFNFPGASWPGAAAGWPGASFPGAAWPGAWPGASTMPGMPAIGPAREQQESWQRIGQLLLRCQLAQMQVGSQWNDIIGRSLRELAERLAPRLKSGAAPESMKEVYDLWVDAAEGVYGQAARAGAFVQAQAELTNATSQLRTAQRELLEEWARQFDLPTRSELNSIHQQLRELKAALAASRG